MSNPPQAVFLSYASQDLEPARRICDALRAAGIEVWFDQSELRGGDAWDAAIRKQVRDCTLFMALISANTNARSEGYFRREWNLAVHRMLDMADDQPFLLPVLIDDTPETTACKPACNSDQVNGVGAWAFCWTEAARRPGSSCATPRSTAAACRAAPRTWPGCNCRSWSTYRTTPDPSPQPGTATGLEPGPSAG
jgi:hypothetical protein